MKLGMPWTLGWLGAIAASFAFAGCLGDLKVTPPGGGGEGGVGGSGATGGAGGAGGASGAGGNMTLCSPSAIVDCDTGQPGTCAAGKATCNAEGNYLGMCLPTTVSFDDCKTAADEDCNGMPISQCTGAIEWKYAPGGIVAAPNDDVLMGIAAMPGGKFAITGAVDGEISAGPAVNLGKMYLAKIDATGALTWEKKFSGTGASAGRALAVDSGGNLVVVGDFSANFTLGGMAFNSAGSKDIIVAKFSNLGDFIWGKSFGGNSLDLGYAIAIDANGNCYVTGRMMSGTVDFGGGPVSASGDDAYLVSYGPDGAYRWGQVFVNPNAQQGRALAVSPDGDVVLVGDSTGNLKFSGFSHTNGGGSDCFIAKFRGSTGEVLWSKTSPYNGDQLGRAVAALPNGNFVVTGRYENKIGFGGAEMPAAGTLDAFVVEFDGASGTVVRQMRAGQAGSTYGQAITIDGVGDLIIHGAFDGLTAWGTKTANADNVEDVYTVKLNGKTWEPLWLTTLGGTGEQFGLNVAVGADGRVVGVGYYVTEINFGAALGKVPTTGGKDFFVAGLAQ